MRSVLQKLCLTCLPSLFTALAGASGLDVKVVGPGGQLLSDAVVSLHSDTARAAVKPISSAQISQRNKTFIPQVLPITQGTGVSFPNEDTVRHHVYSFSETKRFEIKLYVGTPAQPVIFDTPGVAVLGCNIHDHMVAWVVVLDTPYFATTDPTGQARLDNIPAGRYELRVWHKDTPADQPGYTQTIDLEPGDTSQTLTVSPGAPR